MLLRVVQLLFLFLSGASAAGAAPQITIIIDDLGNSLEPGLSVIELPGPIVCAVLPQTPYGTRLAKLADARGKEVLLHLPLQAADRTVEEEPGGLVLDMTQRGFQAALASNIDSVPHAIGLNGHRGSLLTRHPGHMRWLMSELRRLDLVFVDSYTTHHSVALRMAGEARVPATRRDVFLDDDPRPEAIRREFDRLLDLAHLKGSAVAIGHPYPETLDFLRAAIPTLEKRGVRLVGLRALLGESGPSPSRPEPAWTGSDNRPADQTPSPAPVPAAPAVVN